jgi:hypothetical protein
MSTKTSATENTPMPTLDQISETTTAALASADAGAAQTILNLKMVHNARLSQLKRTADSLKKQYGSDDPTVKEAEAAVEVGSAKVARISVVHQELDTPAPQVAPDGWALHGRVYGSNLKPHAKYTVFLVDDQKNYQEPYGFAYTDETGYFLFNVAGVKGKDPAQTTTPLFLAMTNTKGEPVYLSETAFQPKLGSATYQNTILGSGVQVIGNPPEAIRKVALPPKKKRTSVEK